MHTVKQQILRNKSRPAQKNERRYVAIDNKIIRWPTQHNAGQKNSEFLSFHCAPPRRDGALMAVYSNWTKGLSRGLSSAIELANFQRESRCVLVSR